MYNKHIHYGYRKLTEQEAEAAEQAVLWLANQHLNARRIAMLTYKNLERESKVLRVAIETKHLVWFRKIHYAGTPVDTYLTEVLPCLKVKNWLFPNQGWTGRAPSFGFHVHAETVENFLQNYTKKVLISLKRYSKIEASTKETHIEKQIMVGRRIALRA